MVDAAAPREPFALLGISQGRRGVRRLRGAAPRARVAAASLRRLRPRLGAPRRPRRGARVPGHHRARARRAGAGTTPPSARSSRRGSCPGAREEQIDWFNELCRKTTTADDRRRAAPGARPDRRHRSCSGRSGRRRSSSTRATTPSVPIAEGRFLAAGIPGAQFVELDSKNHILLESEPAWARFSEAVLEFMGLAAPRPARTPPSARSRRASARSSSWSPRASATRRSASACRSARRRCATTSPTSSTSSGSGRAPRPSSSPVTGGSGPEGGPAPRLEGAGPQRCSYEAKSFDVRSIVIRKPLVPLNSKAFGPAR